MNFDFESGERAAADLPDLATCLPPGSPQTEAPTLAALSPARSGQRASTRIEAKEDRLTVFYEPCPQGDDCAGDGKHRRLFDCEQGCGFRGCAACMEVHESEPHANDSDASRERFRDVQR